MEQTSQHDNGNAKLRIRTQLERTLTRKTKRGTTITQI